MNKPLYNPGDAVTCNESQELLQPMRVVGLHAWCSNVVLDNGRCLWQYDVVGKHKRNGNDVTVCLSETLLNKFEG